ncbi:MAG: hypothetical protein RL347_1353, partial [Actinomycetota bacterium]
MRLAAFALAAVLLPAALAGCGSDSGGGESPSATSAGGPWATSDCSMIAPPTTESALPEGAVVEGEV